jgi:hypothetical protein
MTQIGVALVVALALASVAIGQRSGRGFGRSRFPPRFKPVGHVDRGFAFCRLMFTSDHREPSGRGWSTDYPFADINFMIRLSELTSTQVDFDAEGEPNHWVVQITDDALFSCPFVLTSDVGTMRLTEVEVERLRTYLLKGGFLWVDDFWGTRSWDQWASEIGRVLPAFEYPIIDLPIEHELFRTLFHVQQVPQISNIRFWRNTGGQTSERGADSVEPHFRVITDHGGRILVAMTHNTDIQDAWEREGEDAGFFDRFAPDGYGLGINVLLHAMTH